MKMANIDAVFHFMFTNAVKSEKPDCPVSDIIAHALC